MSYDVYWVKSRAEKLRILNTLPKRAVKNISTVNNHLFLARLPIFRNKVAVFSFIFIS